MKRSQCYYSLINDKFKFMAKICDICNRGKITGNSRSHSQIATKRTMGINLQSKRLGGVKMNICTSCLKTLNKLKKKQTAK